MFDLPSGATPIDPDVAAGLKVKNVSTRAQLDELEAVNIGRGILWLARKKNLDLLTDTFLKQLHERLFGAVWSWGGEYRQTEKNIGIDPIHISVQVRLLVENAKYWIENGTFDRLEFAAQFHHQLVKIHPFANGNGRHARIATNGILRIAMNEKPVVWGKGSLIADDEERRTYIGALREADAGNIAPLIVYLKSNEES